MTPVSDRSIGALVARTAAIDPDADYLFFEDEVVTWGELDERITRFASGLARLGVEFGDRVAVLMRNRPEYLYAWLGAVRMGAIYVPVIADSRPAEIDHVLRDCGVSVLVTTADLLDAAGDLQQRFPNLRVILVGESADADGVIDFDEVMALGDGLLPQRVPDLGDVAQIQYTSGTTSLPKGVVHTHYPYVRWAIEFAAYLGYGPEDRLMVILPLFHGHAQITSTLASIGGRSSIALLPRFSASRFWDQVRRYEPTQVGMLHGVQSMLLARPPVDGERDHRIRFAWGTTTESIQERFQERFNIPTVTTYGLTECSFVASARPGEPYTPGWVGRPTMDDMEVRIVDPDSAEEVPRGNVGVIAVRSPCVMQGYYNQPEETARALRDGWLLTGDLGRMDEAGELYFTGRLKHVIRRSGDNVSGEEVEDAVTSHPDVIDCAAVAVADDIREEEIKVFVLRRPGSDLTEERVVDWCLERLANFKVPRYVEFREALPVTGSGKVQRLVLAKEPNQTACWDRVAERYRIDWRPEWAAGRALNGD